MPVSISVPKWSCVYMIFWVCEAKPVYLIPLDYSRSLRMTQNSHEKAPSFSCSNPSVWALNPVTRSTAVSSLYPRHEAPRPPNNYFLYTKIKPIWCLKNSKDFYQQILHWETFDPNGQHKGFFFFFGLLHLTRIWPHTARNKSEWKVDILRQFLKSEYSSIM